MKQLADELQGMAALHTALAKMDGHEIDKKAARHSAMREYMLHVGACSAPFSESAARAALTEAVETAIVDDPQNIPGQPFDREPWRWMESA